MARQLPGTDVIRCSALSPFGAVRLKISKPAPGPLIVLDTVVPDTTTSTAEVVLQAPVSASNPALELAAPAAASTGLVTSSPLYSRICTSGAGAGWLNVTAGNAGAYTVTITAVNGFSSAVTLTCDSVSLPTGASCAFDPGSVTPGASQ